MTVGSITSAAGSSLFATTNGNVKTFIHSDESPVQKLVNQRTEQVAATKNNNYFESEDFLRMKAFEIRNRIVLYQNLGLNDLYEQAQAEGAEVVEKYQALLASKSAAEAEGSESTSITV